MKCFLCPVKCGQDRSVASGPCGAGVFPRVASYAPHYWEEPCISGVKGSGAVFFSGCNMHCVFCQNYKINSGSQGNTYNARSLCAIFLELQDMGVHNINLVTAAPHLSTVIPALRIAKKNGLKIPVVYNSNGYETVQAVRALNGLVDIYLPDFKYLSEKFSNSFSKTSDYYAVAVKAIKEMHSQVGDLEIDSSGLAVRGLLIRHLVLPNCLSDSRNVILAIIKNFGKDIHLSVMRQYAPTPNITDYPLNRKLTDREYDRILEFCFDQGLNNIYMQEKESASLSYTPDFD